MNYEIFTVINDLAFKSSLLDAVMIGATRYIPVLMGCCMVLLLTWSIIYKDRQLFGRILSIGLFLGIVLCVNSIIEHLFHTPRPFMEHAVNLVIPHSPSPGFPSTHAMASMAIALGFHRYYKRTGTVFLTLAILTGFSRIYVGHHYPLDVIGGFAITYALYLLFNRYIRIYFMKLMKPAGRAKLIIKSLFLKLYRGARLCELSQQPISAQLNYTRTGSF